MISKQSILMAIGIGILILAMWLFIYEANGAGPTKGDGAAELIKKTVAQPTGPPALPLVAIPTPAIFFLTVTATDTNGLTSLMSSEAVSTTNRPIVVAWNSSGSDITNYTVWRGTNSGSYNRSFPVGTNLITRIPPPAPSNLVVTVTGLSSPWVATNPTGMLLFTGKNLTISTRHQY